MRTLPQLQRQRMAHLELLHDLVFGLSRTFNSAKEGLATASMEVTFSSVEQLGPHRYELIQRSELQGERLENSTLRF